MMKMNLTPDNRDGLSARIDGNLFVLARNIDKSEALGTRDYMIVSRLGQHPKGWIVEPVTDAHLLVDHKGFECVGAMACTMSYSKSYRTDITPGRLNNVIRTADNVNVGWPTSHADGTRYVVARTEPVPGVCYINKSEYEEKKRVQALGNFLTKPLRLIGVPDLTDLVY